MMDHDLPSNLAVAKPKRLSQIDRTPELSPWRRAWSLSHCFLYWMPVSSFPLQPSERTWAMTFLDRLISALSTHLGLRPEIFLQSKMADVLRTPLIKTARQFAPTLGWARRPGTKPRPMPTKEEVQAAAESKTRLDISEMMPQTCYWFLKKGEKAQREAFLGYGGLSIHFLKPDANTRPPELPFPEVMRKRFEQLPIASLEGLLAAAFSTKDGFLAKSKELFGAGLEDQMGFEAIPFILPQLRSEDFFSQPKEECDKWFQLFDVYVIESSVDQGILLASKTDLENHLSELLIQMREEGLSYLTR
jgi:hypothetical protein